MLHWMSYKDLANPLSEAISLQYQHPFDRVFQGLFGISPLEDSKTTEINRIVNVNGNDQKVVALLIEILNLLIIQRYRWKKLSETF